MESLALQGSESSSLDLNPMTNLPPELVLEILTRLPVKSLLRFRCVSKTWCSLISSSHFIKSHINKSTESCDYANQSLLVIPIGCPVNIYSCSLRSILSENPPVNLDVAQPPKRCLYPQLSLLGSCKGIVGILEGSHEVILWNPTLRKSKMLPFSGTNYRKYKIFTYGYGYDELNDDYKVVEICCFCRFGINHETRVNVYSLRSNSWRRIQDYKGGIVSIYPGVFFNGIIHWLIMHRESFHTSWSILSLDLSTEAYADLMQPEYENGDYSLSLGVLEGRFCVFCNYYPLKVDIWMMNEYGKKESWSKFASIPYSMNIRGGVSPVLVSKSGEILVRYGHSLMLYNRADGGFRDCEVQMVGPGFLGTAAAYIQSLASPDLYDNAGDQN